MKILLEARELLGLNALPGHAVEIVQHEPAGAPTSTDRIEAAIARIRGKSLPEPPPDDSDNLYYD